MGMLSTRPAETLQATIGSLLGAAAIIYGALEDGFDVDDLTDLEVVGAIAIIVSFVAAIKTYLVARRQRDPSEPIGSGEDGTVVPSPGP